MTVMGPRRNGFTMIELMVAIAIGALLTMLAMPVYTQFVVNAQIRTATESIANGLREAQTTAIKLNRNMAFQLDTSSGWKVVDPAPDSDVPTDVLPSANVVQSAPRVEIATTGGTQVTFTGLGRIVVSDGALTMVDVKPLADGDFRPLRVVVDPNIGIKACDPQRPKTDPVGCP